MTEIEIKLSILSSIPKERMEYTGNYGLVPVPKTKEELIEDVNYLYEELSSECKISGVCRKSKKE